MSTADHHDVAAVADKQSTDDAGHGVSKKFTESGTSNEKEGSNSPNGTHF